MTEDEVKTRSVLNLKPNKYFTQVDKPFQYQKRGILMMLLRKDMVLGDDVGLGKTLEAIVHFSYIKSQHPNRRALVLTEKSTLKQWRKEFAWLTPAMKTRIISAELYPERTTRVRAMTNPETDVIITTYSMLYNHWHHLKAGMGPDYVLYADEPNYFKNSHTALHKAMTNLMATAGRRYGLTATIIENRLEEAWSVFKIIAPHVAGGRIDFEQDYVIKRKLPNQSRWVVAGYKNLSKFRAQIEPAFYGRLQTDPEVEQELPEVIPKDVEITMSKLQSAKVVEATDRVFEMADGSIKAVGPLPALTLCQQMCNDPALKDFDINSAKLDALVEMLENSLWGCRVAIYTKFRAMVDRIEARLKKHKIEVVRITGKESAQQRDVSQTRFMSDGPDHCRILVLNKAGQRGLNLQKANHLIFFDLPWSYGIYRQIVGRFKRTGATHKKLGVYRFLACLHPDFVSMVGSEQTIDHYTLNVVMRKKKLFDALTGDEEEIATTTSDLMDVLTEIKGSYRKKKEEVAV